MELYQYVSLAVLMLVTLSSAVDQVCDPYTFTSDQYPSILTSLVVRKTYPIKLKATFRLLNSTKTVSFEGLLFDDGRNENTAVTTCRSLGCSVANAYTRISWDTINECEFTCPDGSAAMRTCQFIQSGMACPNDAMSLSECIREPFFSRSNYATNSNQGLAVSVICTECVQ